MRLTRGLLLCGVVGPPLFVATFLVEGATRPGYSAWRNFVSSLAIGDGGWIQIASFIGWAVLALAFAVGVLRRRIVGPGLVLLLYGSGMLVVGLFTTDQSLGYPPGGAPDHTAHGMIHAVGALVAFLANAVAAALTAVHFGRDPRSRGFVRYSAWSGLVVLAFFIASVIVPVLDGRGIWPNAPSGLIQRISIITGCAWIAAFAHREWRRSIASISTRAAD